MLTQPLYMSEEKKKKKWVRHLSYRFAVKLLVNVQSSSELSAAAEGSLYSLWMLFHTNLEYAGAIWGSPGVEQIVFPCAHKPLAWRQKKEN